MAQVSRLGLIGAPQRVPTITAKAAASLTLNCTGSFATLMTSIKTLFNTKIGSGQPLSKVKQIKRGILPPRVRFPVVALVPVSEIIVKRLTGRLVYVERTVDFMIYDRDQRDAGRQAIFDLEDMAHHTRDILVDNYLLTNTGGTYVNYAVDFEEIELAEEDTNQGVLQVARVPAIFTSQELLPDSDSEGGWTDAATSRQISDAIHTALDAESSGELSATRSIIRGDRGPHAKYPALIVSSSLQRVEKAFTGMDEVNTTVELQLLSSIRRGSDEELVQHLTLLDPIKDVLHATNTWSGNTTQSELEGIFFDTAIDNNEVVYRSTFSINLKSRHATSPYAIFAA